MKNSRTAIVAWAVAAIAVIGLLLTSSLSPVALGRGSDGYLFVVTATSGTIDASSSSGTFDLVLADVAPHATYFSDHPDRDAGAVTTRQLAGSLDQATDDPVNAAIVLADEGGGTFTLAFEVVGATYSADDGTLALRVRVLDASAGGLAFLTADEADDAPSSFGTVELFVDAIPTPVNGQITDATDTDSGDQCHSVQCQITD